MTNLSAVTIWRKERDCKFPKRRKISTARVAWVKKEVEAWIDNLINNGEMPDD